MTWLEQVVVENVVWQRVDHPALMWAVLVSDPYPPEHRAQCCTCSSFMCLYLLHLATLLFHGFCTVVSSLGWSYDLATVPHMTSADRTNGCTLFQILETVWMRVSTVTLFLGILSLTLHHPNSYPPQPEWVRNSMLLTKPALAWRWYFILWSST